MVKFRIILVEPEYEINLGSAARVCKNFGVEKLCIVAPKANPKGKNAIMFSKHARNILEEAKITKTLAEAVRGCEFVVGTTGVLKRSKNSLRSPISLKAFLKKTSGVEGEIAVLFGREGTGLSVQEIRACDFLVSIPANPTYSILNLSHALAIVLYELYQLQSPQISRRGNKKERELIMKMFSETVDELHGMRNPKTINLAFKRMLGRSLISEFETKALIGVFKKINEQIKASSRLSA
ncbi:MAG: RNA methyltransferase [Candidatus Micrarchaeota archaeon]